MASAGLSESDNCRSVTFVHSVRLDPSGPVATSGRRSPEVSPRLFNSIRLSSRAEGSKAKPSSRGRGIGSCNVSAKKAYSSRGSPVRIMTWSICRIGCDVARVCELLSEPATVESATRSKTTLAVRDNESFPFMQVEHSTEKRMAF